MNSTTKGFLFVALGSLSLIWFGYEASNFLSGHILREENAAFSVFLTALKLVMTISFFVSAIVNFRKEN